MQYRWLIALMVIVLLAGVSPVQAEIVEIEPPDTAEEGEPLLEPAEVEKIVQLQQGVTLPLIISPVSPDDTTILAAFVEPGGENIRFAFINVDDGSSLPLGNFLEDVIPLTNLAWRDATTLVFVAFDFNTFLPALVAIDRTTASIASVEPLLLPGFPISLSPNGTRLLIALDEAPAEDSFLHSPFHIKVQLQPLPATPALPERLSWLQDEDDGSVELTSEDTTLAYVNLHTQQVVPLTSLPEGSGLVSNPAWSPDGSRLSLVRTTIEDFNLARGELSLATLLTQDTLGNLPPAENPLLQGNIVDVFDISAEEVRSFQIKAADGNGDIFFKTDWSPDGYTMLAQMLQPARLVGRVHPIYTFQFAQSSYVRFYDVNSQQVVGVFDAPEIAAAIFAEPLFVTPGEVLFTTVYGLSMRVYYYNRVSGEFRQISDRAGFYGGSFMGGQVAATRFSQKIVFSFSSFVNPPELYRIGWDGTALAALSYNNSEIEQLNQVQVHELSFTLASGAVRRGYLIQPAGAAFPPRLEPIVLWQEGGPGLFMVNQWSAAVERPFNLLPNFGISLLVLPLPGRAGWGTQFYNALADGRNFGSIDIDEAAEVVRQMIGLGYTSAGQVGITGCSYGGYFTTQSIARHPDIYAAANTQCTLLDTIVEWQTGFTTLLSYLEGSPPTIIPDEYVQDSPAYRAGSIRTPTLIFHGTDDYLPISIVESFHKALEANGVPVRMLKFATEGHGLAEPENQLLAAQEQIRWFRQYLAGGAPVAPAPAQQTQAAPAQVEAAIRSFFGNQ